MSWSAFCVVHLSYFVAGFFIPRMVSSEEHKFCVCGFVCYDMILSWMDVIEISALLEHLNGNIDLNKYVFFFFSFSVSVPFMAIVLAFPWEAHLFPLLARPQRSQFMTCGADLSAQFYPSDHMVNSKMRNGPKWPKLNDLNVQALAGRDGHSSQTARAWESVCGSCWPANGNRKEKGEPDTESHSSEMERPGPLAQAAARSPAHTLQLKACPSGDALSSRPIRLSFL